MANLKPCPFCGSKDVHITQSFPHNVYCLNCGMMVQLAGKAWEKDIPEVIMIWNTRIPKEKHPTAPVSGIWMDLCIKQAKSEATKKFAEKLKEYFPSIADAIDYTAKEVLKD